MTQTRICGQCGTALPALVRRTLWIVGRAEDHDYQEQWSVYAAECEAESPEAKTWKQVGGGSWRFAHLGLNAFFARWEAYDAARLELEGVIDERDAETRRLQGILDRLAAEARGEAVA